MKHIHQFLKILLFSSKEIKYCLAHYISDQSVRTTWFIRNVLTPLIYILLPLFGLFITSEKSFSDILFNGGISILAVNIITMMVTYLRISSDKDLNSYPGDAGIIKREITNIQSGLIDRAQIFIGVGVILYFIQSIFPFPYINLGISLIFIILLAVTAYFSIILGYVMFILRDDEENFKRIYEILNKERENENRRLQNQTSIEGFNQSLTE